MLPQDQKPRNSNEKERNNARERIYVMTISPAAWADLFRHLGLPLSRVDRENGKEKNEETVQKQRYRQQFTTVVHSLLNIHYVLDGNLPLTWSLQEAANEFCRSYRGRENLINGKTKIETKENNSLTGPSYQQCKENLWPSRALSKGKVQFRNPDDGTLVTFDSSEGSLDHPKTNLPLLSGSCPAVVCLVEKTAHNAVSHLSSTRSPMSMAGAWLRQQERLSDNQCSVYHIAVMPCHDKKLEASRTDFQVSHPVTDVSNQTPSQKQQDVDISITTRECLELLSEAISSRNGGHIEESKAASDGKTALKDFVLHSFPAKVVERFDDDWDKTDKEKYCVLLSSEQAMTGNTETHASFPAAATFAYGSGGYADYIFRHASSKLFNLKIEHGEVPWEPGSWNHTTAKDTAAPRSARMAAMQRRNKDFYQAVLYRAVNREDKRISYVLGNEKMSPSLEACTLEPVLRFGLAYGMQNLQRLLKPFSNDPQTDARKVESLHFDYVEAMACPSGCVNGGGQVGLNIGKETPTETRTRLRDTVDHFSIPLADTECPIPFSDRHTTHHVVPPIQLSMGAASGVAVQDIQW